MGTVDEFTATRSPVWDELDALVARARRDPARLGAEGVRTLGREYRAVVADLALARRRFPGTPVVGRLEQLVVRARALVYRTGAASQSVSDFVRRGFWRRVLERPLLLLVSALLLLTPAALAGYWAWRDPAPASGLVPSEFQRVTEPRPSGQDLGLPVDEQAAFSAEIFTNNIRVAILAFAAGITFGLGTAYVLISNGVILGAVAGLAVGAGNGRSFFELVVAHGVLELSCIVVAGLAGLRMGWALVDPGYRPRPVALREEARAAAELLVGVAALLVLAGLVEGFVTPSGLGLAAVLGVGFGLGGLFWALVFSLGRR